MLAKAQLADASAILEKRLGQDVLLLLDGLDEIDPRARRWVQDAVNDFALTHQHTPIVVTCRPYVYQEVKRQLDGFEQAELVPFDGAKIDQFIQAWYTEANRIGLVPTREMRTQATQLQLFVHQPELYSLAQNPLLLTMMSLLHSSLGRLPENRAQLYGDIVDLLLTRWEQSHLGEQVDVQAHLSPHNLRFAIEDVAYLAHRDQPAGEGTADIPEADLRQVLQTYLQGDWNKAGDVIRYIQERAGLLLEHKPGTYAFPHRALQEYLAGCSLSVQIDFPSQAADLVQADKVRWREPLLLAMGKTGKVENRVDLALGVVDNLCPRPFEGQPTSERTWQSARLAGEALIEIGPDRLQQREAWKERLDRVTGWLAHLLETDEVEPLDRAHTGRVLALLGDPRNLDGAIFIPGGPFTMGEGDDEHTVDVAPFYIGRYPVTNGQFARFIEAGGYDERRYWTGAGWTWLTRQSESRLGLLKSRPPAKRHRPFWWENPDWNLSNYPVVGVSWFEALAYTRWLTEQLQASALDLQVYQNGQQRVNLDVDCSTLVARLPTEAEWEKAARGSDSRVYPWGDEWSSNCANTRETGIGHTATVGIFPIGSSFHEVLDMGGAVWEWCSSLNKKYPYHIGDGREDLERYDTRVLRGGSWYFEGSYYARCAYRFVNEPSSFDRDIGFRVAFSSSPPSES